MKLTLKNTLALSAVAVILGFFLASVLIGQETKTAFGSTSRGSEYQSYIASSTSASATAGTVLNTGPSTLGSVVVTSAASAGAYFRVWDATSTATSTYQNSDNTSTSTTYGRLITQFKATAGEQTYTFDANAFKGIVIEVPTSWNGIYTVTYR